MIARLEARHGVADRPDDAGTLMTKNFRKFRGVIGVPAVQIRCTHAARHDFHQQFVASRIAEVKLFDVKGTRALVHHGSGDFHS